MAVKIKIINRRNPKVPTDPPKFYASAQHETKIELDELATAVAERCTLRRSDVHGVLIALMDIIPAELAKGSIVNLGKLGNFSVNVKSEGAETEEEYVPSMVTGTKLVYRPTKELKKLLRTIDISLAN